MALARARAGERGVNPMCVSVRACVFILSRVGGRGGGTIVTRSPAARPSTPSPHPFLLPKNKTKKRRRRRKKAGGKTQLVQFTAPGRKSPPTQLRKMKMKVVAAVVVVVDVAVAGRPC